MKTVDNSGERRKWFARKQKNDPNYARYFCPSCTKYLGAAKKCEECNGQGESQEEATGT